MGRKRTPGLYKRKGIWHIDKKVYKRRLCESTGSGEIEEAEKYLARRTEEVRQAVVYGVRPKRTFREAATRFLEENQQKASIDDYALHLEIVDKYIGDLLLQSVHMGSLQVFIEKRRREGVKSRTINYGLQVVRRILNLAATEWLDENGLTWLTNAPKIKLLPLDDARKPHPLSWEEQDKLFSELPWHLRNMALFAVNTGCRSTEICLLRWDWEVRLPELENILVFIVPKEFVKNREDRLIVCNDVARSVVERVRGIDPVHVFTYRGAPVDRMLNTAWKKARIRAGIDVCVHDLKHTFGRRLRAEGVCFEDRQDLLGHKSGRITTHYSRAELDNLYLAANRVCDAKNNRKGVILTMLRANTSTVRNSRKR